MIICFPVPSACLSRTRPALRALPQILVALLGAALLVATPALLAQFNGDAEIPVSITLKANGDVGNGITLMIAGRSTPVATVTSYGGLDRGLTTLVPFRAYTLSASCNVNRDYSALLEATSGYRVRVVKAGEQNEARDVDGTANVDSWSIMVIPSQDALDLGRGKLGEVTVSDLSFRIGLGRLQHGKPVGVLSLVSDGLIGTSYGLPANLFTPAALDRVLLEAVQVIPAAGGGIRQISMTTGLVDVVPLVAPAIGYRIAFYLPDDVEGQSGGVFTLKGGRTPYAQYTVDQPTAPADLPTGAPTGWNVLRLTATEHGRTIFHHAFRSTTADEWKLFQSRPPATAGGPLRVDRLTATVQTTLAGVRTRTVSVFGADGNLSLQNRYTYSQIGGVYRPTREEVGFGVLASPLETAYTYYSQKTAYQLGQYGNLQTITAPNGLTTSYAYVNTDGAIGRLLAESRPWSDHGSSTAGTWSKSYTYCQSSGRFFAKDVATVIESVDGTMLRQVSFAAPTYGAPAPGLVTRSTVAHAYLTPTSYRILNISGYDASSSYMTAGKPSELALDSGVTTVSVFGPDYGNGSEEWVMTGFSGPFLPPGAVNITFGNTIGFYGLPGKSTQTHVRRNADGLEVSRITYPLFGAAFSATPIDSVSTTYDVYGQVLSTARGNGTTQTFTWSGGLRATETDELGRTTVYNDYDALGRPLSATRTALAAPAGSGFDAVPATTTVFTYDGTGRVRSTVSSDGVSQRTLASTYDVAGRTLSRTDENGLTTTFAYTFSGSGPVYSTLVDETLPGGAHRLTEHLADGKLRSVTGSAVVSEYQRYEVLSTGHLRINGYRGVDGGPRWQSVEYDRLGRVIARRRPGFHSAEWVSQTDIQEDLAYGQYGTLDSETQPGRGTRLYQYDPFGTRTVTALDIEGVGVNLAGLDRIAESQWKYFLVDGAAWREEKSLVYPKDRSGTPVTTGTKLTRLSGFVGGLIGEERTIDIDGNTTTAITTHVPGEHTRTVTTQFPGCSTPEVAVQFNGKVHRRTTIDGLVNRTRYDWLGRVVEEIDPRKGSVFLSYHGTTDRLYQKWYIKTGGAVVTLESVLYDAAGRPVSRTDALGNVEERAYDARGNAVRIWGSGTYPIKHVHDEVYGERTAMLTYRKTATSFGAAVWPADSEGSRTSWEFDPWSGLLRTKTDSAGRNVRHTYNAAGQPATREWARTLASGARVTTTYTYEARTGELSVVNYNDGTAPLAYAYDRMGNLAEVNQGGRLHRMVADTQRGADSRLRLLYEQLPTDLGGRFLSYTYEATTGTATRAGRPSGYALGSSIDDASDLRSAIGYDAAARLSSIAFTPAGGASRTFTYAYASGSRLVSSVSAATSAGTWIATQVYDPQRDLPTLVETLIGGATVARTEYLYNDLGDRTRSYSTGGAIGDFGQPLLYSYGYNSRRELTGASGYLGASIQVSSGPSLATRQFGYTYDLIGNRTSERRLDNPELADEYTVNDLNQIIRRENNFVYLAGTVSPASATVVGGSQLASRAGNTWHLAALPDNPSGAKNQTLGIKGKSSPSDLSVKTLSFAVRPALETISYDGDGNLVEDGLWTYRYDGENRLIRMDTNEIAVLGGVVRESLVFAYDHLGRRIGKKHYRQNGAILELLTHRKYVYQGWNVIAELDGTNARVRTFGWGLDLTASLERAGGIGALLQVQEGPTSLLPAYDGNGNIVAVTNAATGALAASYEYSPFGELLRGTGPAAATFPFRFSTKWTDDETGLVYYGRRYYDPRNGRFVGRDPISEEGGLNLYGFVVNNSVNHWDYLGTTPSASPFGFGPIGPYSATPIPPIQGSLQIGQANGAIGVVNDAIVTYNQTLPVLSEYLVGTFNNLPFIPGLQNSPTAALVVGAYQLRAGIITFARGTAHYIAGGPTAILGLFQAAFGMSLINRGNVNIALGSSGNGTGPMQVPPPAGPIGVLQPVSMQSNSASAVSGLQSNTLNRDDSSLNSISTENVVSVTLNSNGTVTVVTDGPVRSSSPGSTPSPKRPNEDEDEEDEEKDKDSD